MLRHECVTCFCSSLFTFRHQTSCSHQLEGVLQPLTVLCNEFEDRQIHWGKFLETWNRPCSLLWETQCRRRGSQREKVISGERLKWSKAGEMKKKKEREREWEGIKLDGSNLQCESSLVKTMRVPTRAALIERYVKRSQLSFKHHNPEPLLHSSVCIRGNMCFYMYEK